MLPGPLARRVERAQEAAAERGEGVLDAALGGVGRALAAGLARAGVPRLVAVGLASVLPTASGAPLMDTPGYPQEWREFYAGHVAGTDALRAGWTGRC
ncbi:hypothetical protein ACFYYS_33770 [Streptomyces sp. NPDC002120]|uniref:hypothetical protein n=1 Tax=Streptomyces sp. NPDC002120 TaxID=3364631 RepID=UPI0036A0B717